MALDSSSEKRMLKVELFESIRLAAYHEGLSIRGAATISRVHRRTVRQALEAATPPERKCSPVRRSKLAPANQLCGCGLLAASSYPLSSGSHRTQYMATSNR